MNQSLLDKDEYIENQKAELKFRVGRLLGKGAYGQVYVCTQIETNFLVFDSQKTMVVKVEPTDAREEHIPLFWEMVHIHQLQDKTQVPRVYHIAPHTSSNGNKVNVGVIQMLGPDLEKMFQKCKRTFDLSTVLHIAKQMFEIIEVVHDHRLMHRDIKPDNIMVGNEPNNVDKIFLCDFGLCKYWVTDR